MRKSGLGHLKCGIGEGTNLLVYHVDQLRIGFDQQEAVVVYARYSFLIVFDVNNILAASLPSYEKFSCYKNSL